MKEMNIEVEIESGIENVNVYEIEGEKFVNCKMVDIVLKGVGVLRSNSINFARCFKVEVEKDYIKRGKIEIYYKRLIGKKKEEINRIINQLKDVWLIVSAKTALCYKLDRMVIVEKNSEGICELKFEVKR